MFKVYSTPKSEKDLNKIPNEIVLDISREILTLEKSPRPDGNRIKKIRRPFKPVKYELKIKDYRVLFSIVGNKIIIGRIIHRKDLELALKKLQK
ncbi:type II toxin-antitoxin system RelE/ParE family toxin [Elusimicrobiota bacterium]